MNESPTPADADGEQDEAVTVSVSPNGQATIPKEFREKLGIEAPGRVQFRETEDGQIVLERLPTVEEMKGFAASTGGATTEEPASALLRAKREAEKREREGE